MRHIILLFLLVLTACGEEVEQQPIEEKPPELVLTQATFADLSDWGNDDLVGFAPAFGRSCGRILKKNSEETFGVLEQAGTYGDWQTICHNFAGVDVSDVNAMRGFIEGNFTPYSVSADDEPKGLFTGYYESSLKGSRVKNGAYIYPLHARPDDLVMVQLGDFRDGLKGERIAGRVIGGRLKPYEKRSDIVTGNWPHEDKVLLWVDDAVDAFFVQIQGSGLVRMDDGSLMRIGYAGQNGHPYYAIGRELIKIGALTKENVSMQSIRAWLEENPERANEIMDTNKSYVFFREVVSEGAIGAEGVALTAQRSLAVDRTMLSYGLPLWVDIEGVEDSEKPIRRLMIAQDTGGAIRGQVRADMFWGHGAVAENMAGKMKSMGRYWALLPKQLSRH